MGCQFLDIQPMIRVLLLRNAFYDGQDYFPHALFCIPSRCWPNSEYHKVHTHFLIPSFGSK